jgi:mannose-6-phosphate isomerase-like protein (cupin superfamily)
LRFIAERGQSIHNPVAGDTMIFHETAADSEGRRLVFELVLAPGAHGPPEHIHTHQEERFRVISGRIGAKVDGRESVLGPGEAVTVPAGVRHTWWGAGEEESRVMVELEPALEAEGFFETIYGLARDGKLDSTDRPNPFQIAVLMAGRHRGEIYLARPPIPVQKVFNAIAAPIGRRLGYRDRYPEYEAR